MKHLFFTIMACVAFTAGLFAQLSVPGMPLSEKFSINNYSDTIEAPLPPADVEARAAVAAGDEEPGRENGLPIVAESIKVNGSMDNCGSWTRMTNGDLVWQATFTSPGAGAVAVVFSKFRLPRNAELYVYNTDKSQMLGAFTYLNNNELNMFNTAFVEGETLTVELNLYNPKSFDIELEVDEIVHVYSGNGTGARMFSSRSVVDECFVSVNCSPEGDNWQSEKRGVAQMFFRIGVGNSWTYCSGSLIGNTRRDLTPYFLTAFHCGGPSTAADKAQTIFYFEYEKMGCRTGDTIKSDSRTLRGAEMVASSNFNGGTDMLLLKIQQDPPLDWDVYWNGWDFTKNQSPSGVTISHPAPGGGTSGIAYSYKRISTYTVALVPYYEPNNGYSGKLHTNFGEYGEASGLLYGYWEVQWSATPNGHSVTAGGSSGGPLFNNKKQIVGTLTGGGSFCSYKLAKDFYGRFDMQWDYFKEAKNQLKYWLDPLGVSLGTLNGYDRSVIATDATTIGNTSLLLSWQKRGDMLILDWQGVDGAHAEVFSISGQLIDAKIFHAGENQWLLPQGTVYIVRVGGEAVKVQL